MENQTQKRNLILITAGVVLAIVLICAALVFCKYAFVNGHFYAKDRYVYDLRGQALSVDVYDKMAKKLPDSWILWDVPFQGSVYSSDTRELAVFELSDEDVEFLDHFPQLETVHAEGCSNTRQLADLQLRRPNVKVYYNVEIGGKLYNQDTTHIDLTKLNPDDVTRLDTLLKLQSVGTDQCCEYDLLDQIRTNHPEWNVSYQIHIGDGRFTRDAKMVTANGGTYEEIAGALAVMPEAKSVVITDPQADGQALAELQERFPKANLNWQVNIFDQLLESDITELDISNHILSGTEEAERMASYFPKLEKLVMSDCGIDDETMAAFREEKRPDYKVVWTVHFSAKCKYRTDETGFYPTGQGEYHFMQSMANKLIYMEDLICMDLGHHSNIKNVDFLEYTPHLKYLILAHTDVRDITPVGTLKELVFLELDNTPSYPDYSPLLGCTALEDLNLGYTFNDWKPILQMTWLKNLWWTGRKDAGAIRIALEEVMPDCVMNFTSDATVGGGWRRLPNYYAMRDAIHAPYDTSFG